MLNIRVTKEEDMKRVLFELYGGKKVIWWMICDKRQNSGRETNREQGIE
ncbi:hypothetical protein Hdeb2414_s0022g00616091 [Helianthus debilis subsp. tardiflorus]